MNPNITFQTNAAFASRHSLLHGNNIGLSGNALIVQAINMTSHSKGSPKQRQTPTNRSPTDLKNMLPNI